MADKSNGYEGIADAFTRARTISIGPGVVRKWAKRLRPGAAVLDLGCGNGVPISETLLQEGFAVYGVDASATLVAKFRERFPDATVECASVEESAFFHCTFDAVVVWGLMFLLPPETQRNLIAKIARSLRHEGHLLFTSPKEACTWMDGITGLPSISLGHDAYERELTANGLRLLGNDQDEGDNYYYLSDRLPTPE
jgi:2-polyprenyl-3-methyl-5-hydroxy-6-metoxy-1,4-benzoquinol methylase